MDWEDVKTFAIVARARTVRRAAAELGVHHSTVARRISRLEGAISARLFDRRPEGLSLTDLGEELLSVSVRTQQEFEVVERRLNGRDNEPKGRVVASMGEPVASLLIAPGLPRFRDQNPGLDLKLNTTWNVEDLARGDADIAIRGDNNPAETLVGKRLFAYYESVYATESYIEAYRNRRASQTGHWIGWGSANPPRPTWIEQSEFSDTQTWGQFEDMNVQIAVAKAGMGFISLPCFVGDLEPALCRATAEPPRPARDVWLLTHPDLRQTTRIRIAMQFFEDQLRSHRSLMEGRNARS